jgi:Putative Ig domain
MHIRNIFIASTLWCTMWFAGCGGTGGVTGPTASQAQASNRSISGQPASTVAVGQAYSFQPVISAGMNVTFTARNLPAWLTLNAATGRLTGTPQASDVASYSGITLAASDGSTLGPFSITVVTAGSGRATLSWMPPTANTDGSALTDLSGYVIAYGGSPDDLLMTITIDNPSVTTYVVDSLTSGTWHFAIQAVNASGVRSNNSSLASKTIS